MKMTFRWYGQGDKIPLEHIAQIPGIHGVVTALMDIPVGEIWPLEKLEILRALTASHGLSMEVIESVNVHESIKLGDEYRDRYIGYYKRTLENLSKVGVKTVCYNFMPIFDWTRTDLAKVLKDGSTALSFDNELLRNLKPNDLLEIVKRGSKDIIIPGWEPDRLHEIEALFGKYKSIDKECLWRNLRYFLESIIPTAHACDINMAIHPDDPPWSIFGLPRIITDRESLQRLIDLVDSPRNGIALCSGSLGANADNDIPEMIRDFGKQKRLHFGHIRNINRLTGGSFHECSHLSSEGSLDLYEIMKAYYDIGFSGHIRPDHGRMIWAEEGMPGYGLYDRALGVTYLNGLYEALSKGRERKNV